MVYSSYCKYSVAQHMVEGLCDDITYLVMPLYSSYIRNKFKCK
uniref:Uncharacterized protein n=1 Tax=Anguilla anguilla TaxID=7936 RepID=A0A0E9RY85_ANGAN